MKKIAIVTGATGGLGTEFVKAIIKEELDEIWAVGRNEEKTCRFVQDMLNFCIYTVRLCLKSL